MSFDTTTTPNGLPAQGLDPDALFAQLEGFRARDIPWRSGRTFAYVYDAGRELEAIGKRAHGAFLTENAIDPTAFPSLLRLEQEVVSIVARHLGGGPGAAGTFTSGGTESIILAVKAARDHARATRALPGQPELILPTTAHAAFHKAADYLGLKVVAVDVDATFRADPAAVERAITASTVMIVGSAPSYAHGVIDPIGALAEVARRRGVWLHVDACVGGWLLPYWRRLGAPVPAFDLSVDGVSSLSVDLHKYAFCPKGASVVLYRDAALRKHHFYACTEWTGYAVINSAVQSSRSGGPLAAAWAVLHRLGDQGYLELARRTLEATRALVAGVKAIPGLRCVVEPDFCMLAATSDEVGVFHLVDAMQARGWFLQPQLSYRGSPSSIHLSLSPQNALQVESLLEHLRAAVDEVRGLPFGQLGAVVKQALAQGAVDLQDEQAFGRLLAMAGVEGTKLPEKMAGIHEMLDALPKAAGKALLLEFVNALYGTASPARSFADADLAACP